MKINLINDGVSRPVDALITARIRDSLDSEFTLSFTLTEIDTPYIHDNTLVQYGEQYFNVIGYQKNREGQSPTCAVECEHVSYSLNDDEYKLEEFVYSGSAEGALEAVLSGTPLTAGTVEPAGTVNISLTGGTRKAILISVAAIIGGEIEYSGYTVNLRQHRGSVEYIELLGTDNVTDVSYSRDVLSGTTAYNIQLGRKTILSCGDNVHIKFTPLEIDAQTRITAIEYNPYNTHEVEIEVGDYVPDILDNLQKAQNKADTALKTATDTANSLSGYAKKSEVSATVDTYINSEAGRASIVASLSGTYVTESDLSGYVDKTELSAEIGAYIDTQAGTAKIVNNLSGTFVTEDALGNYTQKTELSAGIESYIDTAAGTAKVVSAVSGTYVTQTNLNSALSSYVKTTNLNSSIGAYIDSATGKAKVVSTASGTYQTITGMSEYAKVSVVTTIEQSISEVEAAITLSSSYRSNTIGTNVYALLQLVSNANSSSIKIKADKIDFTGFTTFLRASDLGSSGSTTIDGGRITTGTISADRIDVSKLKVQTIYGTSSYSDTALLFAETNKLYLGGASISDSKVSEMNLYALSTINIFAGSNIYLGSYSTRAIEIYTSSTSGYIRPLASGGVDLGHSSHRWGTLYTEIAEIGSSTYKITLNEKGSIIPSTTSTSGGYFEIGSSSVPFKALYVKNITASGSVSVLGASLKIGNNNVTTYYINITHNTVAPSINNTSMTFHLGTSSAYWHYAYIGSTATYIGNSSSSKLGFFGTTPVARKTVSSSADVATLITALKAYGLIY